MGRAGYAALLAMATAVAGIVVLDGKPLGWVGVLSFAGSGVAYLYLSRSGRMPSPEEQTGRRQVVTHGTLTGAEHHTAYPVGLVFPRSRGAAVAVLYVSVAIVTLCGVGIIVVLPTVIARAGAVVVFLFVVFGVLSAILLRHVTDAADTYTPAALPLTLTVMVVVLGRPASIAVVSAVTIPFFVVFGALSAIWLLGARTGIALLPEGVYVRTSVGQMWVRWENLADVDLHTVGEFNPVVRLHAHSPEMVTFTGLSGWLRRRHLRIGTDATYHIQQLRVRPVVVVRAIQRCRSQPEWQIRLGDPPVFRELLAAPEPSAFSLLSHLSAEQRSSPDVDEFEAQPLFVGEPDRTIRKLRRSLRHDSDPATRSELIRVLLRTSRYVAAEQQLRDADTEGDLSTFVLTAMTLRLQDELAAAEACLRHAADHGHVPALVPLGALYAASGRVAGAETMYRRAIDAGDPEGEAALERLRPTEEPDVDAQSWWRAAADRGDTSAMRCLADQAVTSGRTDEAETWWHAAIDHGDELSMMELGVHLVLSGRVEEGDRWLHRAFAAASSLGGEVMARIVAERLRKAGHHDAARYWVQHWTGGDH